MARRIVLFDACQAITFASVSRLDLILDLQRHAVAIGGRASEEVLRDPARTAVRAAIDRGLLPVERVDLVDSGEAAALLRYDSMPAFQGRGDAEILAIAQRRSRVVGSDDQAVLREAGRSPGIPGIATSLDWIVWAIREDRIRLKEADRLIDRLDVGQGLRKRLTRAKRRLGDLV